MEERKMTMPLLGDPLPDLQVDTTHGPMKIPSDLKGKWFVLLSHPADFTPVCTTEFVAFQKRMAEFDRLSCAPIGMSVDQVFSHIKWVEWIKEKLEVDITFPIIAANDTVANKLGLLHPGKGANTVRAVFVGDPEGKVRPVLYYPSAPFTPPRERCPPFRLRPLLPSARLLHSPPMIPSARRRRRFACAASAALRGRLLRITAPPFPVPVVPCYD